MKSKTPKVLHEICGKSLLEYIVDASREAGVDKNVVIIGHGGDKIKEHFQDHPIIFENQPIGEDAPYGTGYAVIQGQKHIEDDSNVVILCGDTPLITKDTVDDLLKYHRDNKLDGTVVTTLLDNPIGYGRIMRDKSGNVSKIIEDKDATEKEKEINEINSGIYCFNGKLLKEALGEIDNDNTQGEFYITDVVRILRDKGYKIGGHIIENPDEIHGINSRSQLAFSESIMRDRINSFHMENGVTLINPENTYIEKDVEIGNDTVIYPGVNLEKGTKIGSDCIIRSGSRIIDSVIKDNVEIESSLIEKSIVDNGTNIGPNAHLRPNSKVGKNVNIGNFVEVKNAVIGDNSKAGHLAYIGDAVVGKDVNIGCGVIFENYDGKNKEISKIGDNVFIGSNSNLVAPLNIEDLAYIAAGSTITEDIKKGSLSIARARQVNKEDWVYKKGPNNQE